MVYDLVLCECVCGGRVAYPVPRDTDPTGFVCDSCLLRYVFDDNHYPKRLALTDDEGEHYSLGFMVFSLISEHTDLALQIVESWFPANPCEVSSEDTTGAKE